MHVNFFGGWLPGQIESPDLADSHKVGIASLLDLFGTKCVTVAQRNETKDYLDIHALLAMTSWTLADGLAAARSIYGNEYDPMITLQALSYFDDLSEALPSRAKADLLTAVNQVSLETVVEVQRHYPREALRKAYLHAPPGLFTNRAWAYWGLVLLGDPSRPLPRRFPNAKRIDWRKSGVDT